jgi:hypothetical protein
MRKSAVARSLKELRLKAEASLTRQDLPLLPPVDIEPQKLLHELRVRQIEQVAE